MTIDLGTIPAARLALLDTALLYNGSHSVNGGPDCRHCARELLHEIVTGEHRDATPPGCTEWAGILPGINDGPWRDDSHRTDVMRPYLRKFLPPAQGGLDPARDEARVYAVIDWCYRDALPEIFEALKPGDEAAQLRALPEIVDCNTAARALACARGLAHARGLDLALAHACARARGRAWARGHALDLACARGLAHAHAHARAHARGRAWAAPETWEKAVRRLLDRICAVG